MIAVATEPKTALSFDEMRARYNRADQKPSMGVDIECFIVDRQGVVPADNIVPSEKNALHTWDNKAKHAVYWDGIQAEIRTRATTCHAYVLDDMVSGFQTLYRLATERNANLEFTPAIRLTEEIMNRVTDPKSMELGCQPHRSADTNGEEEKVDIKSMVRSAGFHIHVGNISSLLSAEIQVRTVMVMDLIVGLIMLQFEDGHYDEMRRQTGYGSAGVFRSKPYGFEYRPLSISSARHPSMASLALRLARISQNIVRANLDSQLLSLVPREEVRRIINEVDIFAARTIIPKLIPYIYHMGGETELTHNGMAALSYIAGPGQTALKVPSSVVLNWNLAVPLSSTHGNMAPSWATGFPMLIREGIEEFDCYAKTWNPLGG